jgi:hypothetical protein
LLGPQQPGECLSLDLTRFFGQVLGAEAGGIEQVGFGAALDQRVFEAVQGCRVSRA